ncbi:PrgI family protein, partial [bacterium 1XD42-8]
IYEKDGQPLEAVLRHMIRAQFLCQKTRPYQTDNLYAAFSRQTKEVSTIENKTAGKAGKKPASGKKGTEKRKV